MYSPRSCDGTMRDSSPVTHGKVNAVPSGMSATLIASTPIDGASGIVPSPTASITIPARERRGSPSQSTALPRKKARVKNEMMPT